MGLARIAAFALVATALIRWIRRKPRHGTSPAFASGEFGEASFVLVRNAGPEAMRDGPDAWDKIDQAIDEASPPASSGALILRQPQENIHLPDPLARIWFSPRGRQPPVAQPGYWRSRPSVAALDRAIRSRERL